MSAEDAQRRGGDVPPEGGEGLDLTLPSLAGDDSPPGSSTLLPEVVAELEDVRQSFLSGLEEDLASMEGLAASQVPTRISVPAATDDLASSLPDLTHPERGELGPADGEVWPAVEHALLEPPVLEPDDAPPTRTPSGRSIATPTPRTPTPASEGVASGERGLLSYDWLTEPQTWREGAVVAGRYKLLGTLGRGGMGDVLLADDLLLRRKVAIKALRRNLNVARSAQVLERFRQEVAMAHAVSHVGVARTFDMGEAGGVTFLSMEYLEGETLASRLRREGPLPVNEVRRLALEVAAALDAAHHAGVVHRDLKPSNIQLTPDRGAVVMDFGLAAAIDERRGGRHGKGRSELLRPSSKSAGTPNYMAPEQWRGEPQGVATDMYSYGCILFEALTGRLPFQGTTRTAMMLAHLEEKPPSVATLRAGVPRGMDRLVSACLEKEPKDRPRSMFEAARMLVERRVRHALGTAVLALGVLLALCGGGVVIWQTGKLVLLQQIRPAVMRLAMLAAKDIEGADLDQVRRPEHIRSASFQRVWRALDKIRRENPEVRYAYTMRKLKPETQWEFVVDLDPVDRDENGNGVIDPGEQGAPPGLRYDASSFPWLHLTFLQDAPHADERFTEDPWGLVLSGYAPIATSSDDFYVVGLDVTNEPLLLMRNTIYAVFLVLGLTSAVMVVLLRRRKALLLSGFGRVRVGKS